MLRLDPDIWSFGVGPGVKGLGFRVSGLGSRVQGLGFRFGAQNGGIQGQDTSMNQNPKP